MKPEQIRKTVNWIDLKHLSRKEKRIENLLPLPWLIGEVMAIEMKWYVLAPVCSTFFFLAGLRFVHNGFHQSLGWNKKLTQNLLTIYSPLMLTSIHAVKYNHLQHHKHCMTEKDNEGIAAHFPWWKAILYGPVHYFKINYSIFTEASSFYRKRVTLELLLVVSSILGSFISQNSFLLYHICAMVFAECLMAFFAVWCVHHDTAPSPDLARTQRKRWKNRLTYNMFYHLEHHLFPAVPTIKLPELAKRIDERYPTLEKHNTF